MHEAALKQQPVAAIALISSAYKMISDMERIGDQAADIAEITKFIKNINTKSILHIKIWLTRQLKWLRTV